MHPKELPNLFRYHAPLPGQAEKYQRLRDAAHAFAQVVLEETPVSADQSAAVRKIREAVMTANAAIACAPAPLSAGSPGVAPVATRRPEHGDRAAPMADVVAGLESLEASIRRSLREFPTIPMPAGQMKNWLDQLPNLLRQAAAGSLPTP